MDQTKRGEGNESQEKSHWQRKRRQKENNKKEENHSIGKR